MGNIVKAGITAAAIGVAGAAAYALLHRDRSEDAPPRPVPPAPSRVPEAVAEPAAPAVPVPVPAPHVRTDAAKLDAELGARFTDAAVPLHEWRAPDGPLRGVMLVVHGGGWYGVGPDSLRTMDGEVARWNERGWATLNVDYRPGGDSAVDVLRAYDALRAWQGADVPIGAIGASAGGHLAMLLGAERDDVAFVVSEAGPTDIPAIGGNPFADGVREAGVRAFGDDAAGLRSPVARAREINAPLIVANAVNDGIVPVDQLHRMRAAKPDATYLELQPGESFWVHSKVADESLARFHDAEQRLADAAALPVD